MSSPPGVTALHHVGVIVPDLDRAVAWHERVLGSEIRRSEDGGPQARTRSAVAALGASDLELVELAAPVDAPPRANNDVGAFHVCLRTSDIEASHRLLLAQGVRPTTAPERVAPGMALMYFRDPDGVQYQLLERDGTPAGGDLSFDHVGLTVSDLDAAVGWFERVFALEPVGRADAAGEVVSRLLAVPGAAYRVALLQIGDAMIELMQFDAPAGRITPLDGRTLGSCHVCFGVSDLEAQREHIEQCGVAVTVIDPGSASRGYRSLVLTGPDGLALQLAQSA